MGRKVPFYELGGKTGPNPERFNLPDGFDKSPRLSKVRNTSQTIDFERQFGHHPESVIKGGQTHHDIRPRQTFCYLNPSKDPVTKKHNVMLT